ncbi:Transposase [Oopsacas minuta]|uniref:Transposase n=1 Tax=Oopsacas minuta TaxID=111878 RepID=A0AAV7JTJ7_9METZ|nr:Transposase [Oopsacas minuta]
MQSQCKEQLDGKNVSMMLDGWSNIHNEPVVCVSVTTSDGDSYLTETVDTSGMHTLLNIYKKWPRLLLYRLYRDTVVKNTHLPAAWYKFAVGKKLVPPQEVRWNTIADSLQCYLENWTMVLKVYEEHRDTINGTIAMKVQNINIKRNAEDYLKRMKPIAVALDKVQSDGCKLSDAVEDSRYRGINLSKDEVDAVLELYSLDYTSCLPTVINFKAEAGPFKPFMFTEEVLKTISPLTWWESQKAPWKAML